MAALALSHDHTALSGSANQSQALQFRMTYYHPKGCQRPGEGSGNWMGTDTEEDRLQRVRAALSTLCWTAEALARATGMRPKTAHRIVAGRRPIWDWLLAWLEDLAAYHRANPPPPPPAPEDGEGR